MPRPFDWFWSDTHFGHANIIQYSNRPFKSIEQMNDVLIANFRTWVKPDDTVLWLGDAFFGTHDFGKTCLAQMWGTHVLVRGNHDRSAAAMAGLGFAAVTDVLTLSIQGRIVRATHKPVPVGRGEVCLHGHTHQATRRVDNRVHVGVDAWDFRPASYAEVCRLVSEV